MALSRGTAAFVVALVLPVWAPVPFQKPQASMVLASDYEAPPDSLTGMWNAATLVVRARITRSDQHAAPGLRYSTPLVKHEAVILEVFKGPRDPSNLKSVVVAQEGGVIVSDGRQVAVDDRSFPVFQSGEEGIFFLLAWPQQQAYVVAWGPAGVFKISKTTVVVPPAAFRVAEFRDKKTTNLDDLLKQLRALKKVG